MSLRLAMNTSNAGPRLRATGGTLARACKQRVQIQFIVADAAGAAQDTAATLEKWLRRTIETQPYTTAIVAIGVGWLLGRMHRPL